MSILFVGGTAEQCIASAILQQKGVRCDVVCASEELGTPWVGVSFEAILTAGNVEEISSIDQHPGLSVLFVESVKEEIKDVRPTSLVYECVTEILTLNCPLILLSSVANMGDYYNFIYVEEPLIVYKGQVLQAPTCVSSIMKSEGYSIAQRRNILRFLKTMEEYFKAFHLSYVELTDRDDADLTYMGLPPELFVLQKFENENARIKDVVTYFKVSPTFFAQLLLVPETLLDQLTFTDLLIGVVNLVQSLQARNNNRSRCVLEYGLSDIVQSFVRLLFSYGGLGLSGCTVEVQNSTIKVNPRAGEAVTMTPSIIYLCDCAMTVPSTQIYFLLKDNDGAISVALEKHVHLTAGKGGDSVIGERHIPLNFTCILSNCVTLVRIGEGVHLKRGFISVLAQPLHKKAPTGSPLNVDEDPLSLACNIRDTVRKELPTFMGLSADQFRIAECAVVGTHYDYNQAVDKLNPFTSDQITTLANHCIIRKYSTHQLFSPSSHESSGTSTSDILLHATTIIREVLEMPQNKMEWTQDLRRIQRIDECRRFFSRQKSTSEEINLDEFQKNINDLVG